MIVFVTNALLRIKSEFAAHQAVIWNLIEMQVVPSQVVFNGILWFVGGKFSML